jgi:hypothetical protein
MAPASSSPRSGAERARAQLLDHMAPRGSLAYGHLGSVAVDQGLLWTHRLSLCTVRRAQERRMAGQRAWQGHVPPRAVPRWPVHAGETSRPGCVLTRIRRVPRPSRAVSRATKNQDRSVVGRVSRTPPTSSAPSLLRPGAPLLILLRVIPVHPSTQPSRRRTRRSRRRWPTAGAAGAQAASRCWPAAPPFPVRPRPATTLARLVVGPDTFPSDARSPPAANSGRRHGTPPG